MAKSLREKRNRRARAKNKPVKWYAIRMVFWALVLAYGFVLFMLGWVVGRFV